MPDAVTAMLRVGDTAEIGTSGGALEILAYSLQASLGWEAQISRTVGDRPRPRSPHSDPPRRGHGHFASARCQRFADALADVDA